MAVVARWLFPPSTAPPNPRNPPSTPASSPDPNRREVLNPNRFSYDDVPQFPRSEELLRRIPPVAERGGQEPQQLSLNAETKLVDHVPSLFARFDSVMKLALRCNRRSTIINDDTLILISLRCKSLTRLKLHGCREITKIGMLGLAKNCKSLKKLSCGSCMFGVKGLYAVIEHYRS